MLIDEFFTISYGACNPYILDNRVKSSFVLSGVARGPCENGGSRSQKWINIANLSSNFAVLDLNLCHIDLIHFAPAPLKGPATGVQA